MSQAVSRGIDADQSMRIMCQSSYIVKTDLLHQDSSALWGEIVGIFCTVQGPTSFLRHPHNHGRTSREAATIEQIGANRSVVIRRVFPPSGYAVYVTAHFARLPVFTRFLLSVLYLSQLTSAPPSLPSLHEYYSIREFQLCIACPRIEFITTRGTFTILLLYSALFKYSLPIQYIT